MTDASVTPDNDVEAEAPGDEEREGLLAAFTEGLGDQVVGSHIVPGRELWVRVAREAWTDAADLARNRLGCTFFDFLSAIDWMPSPWGRYEYSALDSGLPRPDPDAPIATGYAGGDTRFQVFARLAKVTVSGSVGSGRRCSVILKTDLPDDDLRLASLVGRYAGANWHERECWEMYGIVFDGHPGLRHLYLPSDFEGHPLRKDFPLLARLVKPWPGIVDVEPMPEVPEDEGEGGESAGDESGDNGTGDDATEAGNAG